jgi:hypothetical protein
VGTGLGMNGVLAGICSSEEEKRREYRGHYDHDEGFSQNL